MTLDGLASLKRHYSWVRGRPKIVGHVEQLFLGNVQSDAEQPQVMVLMLTYILNKHIAPVKIREWQLTVKKSRREWPANRLFIREDMIVDWARDVYWAQGSQLYGADTKVDSNKGIRGWLLFVVPGVNSIDPGEKAELKLLIRDSWEGRHTIKSSSIVSKALMHRFTMIWGMPEEPSTTETGAANPPGYKRKGCGGTQRIVAILSCRFRLRLPSEFETTFLIRNIEYFSRCHG